MQQHARTVHLTIVLVAFVLLLTAEAQEGPKLENAIADCEAIHNLQSHREDANRLLHLTTSSAMRSCCIWPRSEAMRAIPLFKHDLHVRPYSRKTWIIAAKWKRPPQFRICVDLENSLFVRKLNEQIAATKDPVAAATLRSISEDGPAMPEIHSIRDFETVWNTLLANADLSVAVENVAKNLVVTRRSLDFDNVGVIETAETSAIYNGGLDCTPMPLRAWATSESNVHVHGDNEKPIFGFMGYDVTADFDLPAAPIHADYTRAVSRALRRSRGSQRFDVAFRDLAQRTTNLKSLDPGDMVAVLDDDRLHSNQPVDVLSMKIPLDSLKRIGLFLLLACQLYLWSCIRIMPAISTPDTEWIGSSRARVARAVTILSVCIFPAAVAMTVTRVAERDSWFAVVATTAWAVSILAAVTAWQIWFRDSEGVFRK